MGKGNEDEQDKLLMLAAAFYAVRLFRSPVGLDRPEADRDVECRRAALDAKSLLNAVKQIP